jgi:hypothetical protein
VGRWNVEGGEGGSRLRRDIIWRRRTDLPWQT